MYLNPIVTLFQNLVLGAHGHGRSAMLLSGCLLKSGEASSLDHAVSIMAVSVVLAVHACLPLATPLC